MAKYRTTQIGYWNDPYIERLSKDGKLLYIYLITSPHTNNLGLLEVTVKKISFETDIDAASVESLLAQMERDGKIVRDKDYIWLVNFIRHQSSTSPKIRDGLAKEADGVSSAKILAEIAKRYPDIGINAPASIPYPDENAGKSESKAQADTLSIPYGYPMDTLSIPFGEREREREREREQEQEREREEEFKGDMSPSPEPTPPDGGNPPENQPSLFPDTEPKPPKDACPHRQIVELYHEILPELPHVRVWDGSDKANLRARWREAKERQSLDWWRWFFGYVARSDFLMGQSQGRDGKPFFATLGWLVTARNFRKILNGNYSHETLDVFQQAAVSGYRGTRQHGSGGAPPDWGPLRGESGFIDVETTET